jgi:hypothetical protein
LRRKRDYELNIDKLILPLENGYHAKFEANLVMFTDQVPHGVKYNIVLLDPNNSRVLGYDNAHSVAKILKRPGRYKTKKITWDHKHYLDTGCNRMKTVDYHFKSASQLIDDFCNEAYRIMGVIT